MLKIRLGQGKSRNNFTDIMVMSCIENVYERLLSARWVTKWLNECDDENMLDSHALLF